MTTPGGAARAVLSAPHSVDELEDELSRPTPAVLDALAKAPGDVTVLGAGGKMGPSLVAMLCRAASQLGDQRRVIAVSRFTSGDVANTLTAAGAEVVRTDLAAPGAMSRLARTPNVIFMAGQKFGTREDPVRTWTMNARVSALAAEHFARSRTVVFSTGNVYPLVPVTSGGASEDTPLAPVGEYAISCLARERLFESAATVHETPLAVVRLNYAVDLRYGVLVDLALKVAGGAPIDVTMGHVNVIWQGDANALAIQCLPRTAVPPFVVNLTGSETISIRDAALELGRRLGREPVIEGREAPDALLSNSTRLRSLVGGQRVSAGVLLHWVAEWIQRGGPTLGKPTHYDERSGNF